MSPSLPGPPGPPGKSAYEAAVEGGYTGTEAEFNAALAEVDTALQPSDVDDELLNDSENLVQNKVVTAAFANLPTPSTDIAEDELTAIGFTITAGNLWAAISGTSQAAAGVLKIPAGTRRIRISPSAPESGSNVWAFLNSVNTAATPDFSESYPGRITATGGDPIEYAVESDMRFIYLLEKTAAGVDVFPAQVLLNPIETDATLSDSSTNPVQNKVVTGALDGKAPVIYDTASGAVASFPDGAGGMPIKSLVVNIEPVQAGSGDPSPTNIRPFTGWAGCTVLKCSESAVSPDQILRGRLQSTGEFNTNTTTRCATQDFIPAEPGTTYTVAANAGVQCIAVHYYAAADEGRWISRDALVGQVSAFTTPENCAYMRLMYAKNNTSETISPAEITATVVTVAPESIEIQFPAEAGTVYGGTMDAFEKTLKTCPYYASYNGEMLTGPWMSSMDVFVPGATPTIGAQVVDFGGVGASCALAAAPDSAAFPGKNNIFADCGPVTVEYPADTKLYIQKINAPSDDNMTADTQIASGKYFIVGGNLYLSTTTIPAGDTIIPGTNCVQTNLAEALNALNA